MMKNKFVPSYFKVLLNLIIKKEGLNKPFYEYSISRN